MNRKQIEKWFYRIRNCTLVFDSSSSLGWKNSESLLDECCNLIDKEYSYGFYDCLFNKQTHQFIRITF